MKPAVFSACLSLCFISCLASISFATTTLGAASHEGYAYVRTTMPDDDRINYFLPIDVKQTHNLIINIPSAHFCFKVGISGHALTAWLKPDPSNTRIYLRAGGIAAGPCRCC